MLEKGCGNLEAEKVSLPVEQILQNVIGFPSIDSRRADAPRVHRWGA